jgi:N-acetylmuramoyl-L-alanine amidase CwlA
MQLDQAFRDLNIVQDFIPLTNSNRPGKRLAPTRITIHNTDNAGPRADAAAHARYVKGADAQARQVSWHYTVDDRVIYQSLPVNEIGWHSGPGNVNSIGIEICMHQGMNESQAYDRAALLVAVLALQNGIAVPDAIVQHNFWTGKHCPRILRDKPNGWNGFLAKVQAALTRLRSAPKDTPLSLTHDAGHETGSDACDVMSVLAPKGAARGKEKRAASRTKAGKKKAKKTVARPRSKKKAARKKRRA